MCWARDSTTLVALTLERQEKCYKFQASLGYRASSYLKNKESWPTYIIFSVSRSELFILTSTCLPPRSLSPCPGLLSVAGINTRTNSTWGRRGFILSSISWSIIWGHQGRSLQRTHGGMVFTALHGCLTFWYRPNPPACGWHCPQQVPPTSNSKQGNAPSDMLTRQPHRENSSIDVPAF